MHHITGVSDSLSLGMGPSILFCFLILYFILTYNKMDLLFSFFFWWAVPLILPCEDLCDLYHSWDTEQL